MRMFVVYTICLSLATPAFAVGPQKSVEKPAVGSDGVRRIDMSGATTQAPATAVPAPAPASANPAETKPASTTAAKPAGTSIPKPPESVRADPVLLKGWNTSSTIRNAIRQHLKAHGKVNDKEFIKQISKMTDDADVVSGKKKKTTAAQAATPPPTVPASVASDATPPAELTDEPAAVTEAGSAVVPRKRDKDKNKENDGTPTCLDGDCLGTTQPRVLTPEQQGTAEELGDLPAPRHERDYETSSFDWRSGLIGGGIGLLGGLFLGNMMNKDRNRGPCYMNGGGWGPGGQGNPWWLNNRFRQLPGSYPAPGGFGGVLGNGQLPPWAMQQGMPGWGLGYGGSMGAGGGFGYNGGWGYGANPIGGSGAPIALSFPGPAVNNGFSNIYNTPTFTQPALYGGTSGIPSIVQAR